MIMKLPNLSCSKSDPNSSDCFADNPKIVFSDAENLTKIYLCDTKMGPNPFNLLITNLMSTETSSGPLSVDQIIGLKLRMDSSAPVTEFICKNYCKTFSKASARKTSVSSEKTQNNATTPAEQEHDNTLATSAIYLYGWLTYRLVFIFLQQL